MTLDPLVAHAIALLLVASDQTARTIRIRLLTGAIGHRITLRDAFAANAIGEVACAVTPMRIGGEPARLASLLRAGVPATASFIAIAFEVITMWPVTIASAVTIAVLLAPGWLEETGPVLLDGIGSRWGWLALFVAASFLVVVLLRRRVHLTERVTSRPWHRARVYWRRMPLPTILAAGFCSFVNLAGRTAILPVLMMTLPEPPPLGPAILGSFALLYSQTFLPMPSGAGVVDLGFLAGAAGSVGDGRVGLLVAWRFYTTFLGSGIGGWFVVRDLGVDAIRRIFRPRH